MKALRAMKDQADQLRTYLKKLLDHKEYSTLTTSAISNHDILFKIKENKLLRKVYFHQYNFNSDFEESKDFNINIPVSTILASITKRNFNNNASHFIPLEK